MSVLMINGTGDPLIPFEGGDVRLLGIGGRGQVLKTTETVQRWVQHNGCKTEPQVEELPDADPNDGTRVQRIVYGNGREGAEVILYKIAEGGHTWPGGIQYLSPKLVGRVCRDIKATEIIWEFFSRHQRN